MASKRSSGTMLPEYFASHLLNTALSDKTCKEVCSDEAVKMGDLEVFLTYSVYKLMCVYTGGAATACYDYHPIMAQVSNRQNTLWETILLLLHILGNRGQHYDKNLLTHPIDIAGYKRVGGFGQRIMEALEGGEGGEGDEGDWLQDVRRPQREAMQRDLGEAEETARLFDRIRKVAPAEY